MNSLRINSCPPSFAPAAGWLVAIAGVMLAVLAALPSEAAIPRGPVLEERLLLGLRVKTDADRLFIHHVVELVEDGKLPIGLVDGTYFWAREKAEEHRRLYNNPMVFFRPALRARAARLGIRI
ncbi:hypothetical protein NG895_12705 [Aeoliella sp. ICT_H6.2]|uniref:Uncharacterized protein n=1 Tax=Aeoliella straminimaris TaxID=2954799 RepID=A0A9X2FA56_9BACT|nr:hypothetical protein [Aeoliella straminimaris]MCO6044769.1 hypothetical protein [Aeoliella straminimaris]